MDSLYHLAVFCAVLCVSCVWVCEFEADDEKGKKRTNETQ